MYAFQTYEYDVMFKPGYSARGRMIPAFDAGDEFRDLNIANIAYARITLITPNLMTARLGTR